MVGGRTKSNSIRYTRWVVMCTEASLLPGYAVIICVGVILRIARSRLWRVPIVDISTVATLEVVLDGLW
jgi:hypothetical protein